MKKALYLLLCAIMMTGCQESLSDRAAREAKEYTKKNCPIVISPVMTLDSMTFDKGTTTFTHYYTVSGVADDQAHVDQVKDKMRADLNTELHANTSLRIFKDAGYAYRYIMLSQSSGKTLFDTTLKKEDYQ